MKFYANKLALCSVAAFGLTMLAACGDSNTTEVTEQTGMDILAKGEKLPDCTKDNAGDMLYVADSAAVYYCADGKWATLNGKDGEGKAGTGCTAKAVDNGIEVSCDGKVIGTVKNGKPGTATDGTPGVGCTIDETAGNGIVKVTCGEGKDAKTVTLYKAMCGTESYEPAEKFCSEGKLYSCDGKPYDPSKFLCDSRDEKNAQLYKIVTISGSYKVVDEQTKKESAVQYEETWMAENLNYNTNTESVINSWCGGGEAKTKNEGDCSVYGRLYTWSAAIDSVALASDADNPQTCGYGKECDRLKATALAANPIQGVCPTGWHLPSDAEWENLFKVVDEENTADANTVGQKLKANSSLWKTHSGVKNDDTFGFSVLPAGFRDSYGDFYDGGYDTSFWRASEYGSYGAYYWDFHYSDNHVYESYINKDYGFSVRCLKDSPSASSASN